MGESQLNRVKRLGQLSYVVGAMHDGPVSELRLDIPEDATQVRLYYLPGAWETPKAGCLSFLTRKKVLPGHEYVGMLDFENPKKWELHYRQNDLKYVEFYANNIGRLCGVNVEAVME